MGYVFKFVSLRPRPQEFVPDAYTFQRKLSKFEPMKSKMQPVADYWIVHQENLGTRLCYIWWAKTQRAKWRNSFKNGKIIWMNNKATIELLNSRRVLLPWSAEFFISSSDSSICDKHEQATNQNHKTCNEGKIPIVKVGVTSDILWNRSQGSNDSLLNVLAGRQQ